ncbi:hypothetical protein A8L34_28175 [Bacillus sp. FJAT-27264]|uniref:AbrB/MazE/SpoVT family DNA-binding domain-containing protein n=1 Tax=Paenibacillus sp. (strain DSM 101736 / FJAT-27264) TaxID=1850362 RepID=UPI000807D7A3|nr:AbrB/MazE/SpoVT family DNA-binding domain-containing protein [Bacillus sp. FJAT-27264]OBZ15926.1 hypothetical protein A8L34_28175 [Bacillus sp. FJAT-27264]
MFKSTITSKGQLTIPKEIRERLNLKAGDGVLFKIDDENNTVLFEKDKELIECPVCKGYGKFSTGHLCFVCDQTKVINSQSIWELIQMIQSNGMKYGVGMSVIWSEKDLNEDVFIREIPKIGLYSKKYFEQILDIAHDYLQLRLIQEYATRSVSEPEKFMHPSDVILNETLSLLKSEAAIETARNWFRGEKNIFPVTDHL